MTARIGKLIARTTTSLERDVWQLEEGSTWRSRGRRFPRIPLFALRPKKPVADKPPTADNGGSVPPPPKSGFSDNFIGAVAYLTPAPAFFFLAIRRYNKRPYVRFHAWQSLVFSAFVFIFSYILNFVLSFTTFLGPYIFLGLRWLFLLILVAVFLVWLWCVVNALNGKRSKLPIIGDWADEQAYR